MVTHVSGCANASMPVAHRRRSRTWAFFAIAVCALFLGYSAHVANRSVRIRQLQLRKDVRIELTGMEWCSRKTVSVVDRDIISSSRLALKRNAPGLFSVQAVHLSGTGVCLDLVCRLPELRDLYVYQTLDAPDGNQRLPATLESITLSGTRHSGNFVRWLRPNARLRRVVLEQIPAEDAYEVLAKLPGREFVKEVELVQLRGEADLLALADYRGLQSLKVLGAVDLESVDTLRRLPLATIEFSESTSIDYEQSEYAVEWVEMIEDHATLQRFNGLHFFPPTP
jgi:hypothetical protein